MLQDYESLNELTSDGKPSGGSVYGTGIEIHWQNGPLGRPPHREEPNGAFVETLLAIVAQRLAFYNENGFHCEENDTAIYFVGQALEALNARTARREAAGTEGTHAGS